MIRQPRAESREPISPRYNHRIRQMVACASSGLRVTFPHSLFVVLRAASLFFGVLLLSPLLFASPLSDTARQLGDRIAAIVGPGAIALDIANRSSLDENSVREVRGALETELRTQGVRTADPDQSMGTVSVVLSESLREYVWTAQISIGTDQPRVVLVSLPRPPSTGMATSALPLALKKTLLFSQEQPILDAALVDMWGGSRLFILDPTRVAVYSQQSSRWQLETSLPIEHAHPFPRDPRGRLLLRRDHLFDAYLPGVICRSSAAAPLSLTCAASDDPWPLMPDDASLPAASVTLVRAFYAPARNFFTGALSPSIGRISDAPSFYSAAALPRPNYTLWVLAAVDGSTHVIDGITDQVIHVPHFGSDIAAIRSNCGLGTQLLVDESGDSARDTLRAFEIPDREPVAVSPTLDFDGSITVLWPDATLSSAVAVVKKEDPTEGKREDKGWYEAFRISIVCTN